MMDVTSSMSEQAGHVLGLQVGDSEPVIHTALSHDDVIELISQADERLGAEAKAAQELLNRIHEEVIPDPDRVVEYYLLHYARSKVDDLLRLDLESFAPEEHRKRVEEYHRYGLPGTVLLYRDLGFGGDGARVFTVPWPKFSLSPYRFNDMASSGKAFGFNMLFEHTWYRGRVFYMIGAPYFELDDFRRVEFNDIASSKF